MNERDLNEFLNDPGDLFVRQCEQLWQEMWTISNDGEHSMALRKIAEAIFLYLELPGIYDKASAAEQDGIQAILMTTWTAIIRPLEDFTDIPPGPHPAAIAEAAQRARELVDALGGLGALSADENVLVAPSLKLCANMAWQLPKPARYTAAHPAIVRCAPMLARKPCFSPAALRVSFLAISVRRPRRADLGADDKLDARLP